MNGMTDVKRIIRVQVLCSGVMHTIETYAYEYRSLMMLIYDKVYPEGFGECKGTGRCGTCHVQILTAGEELLERHGNEESTLAKMGGSRRTSRLACQMLIDERLDDLIIEVMKEEV